ncbi:MAG: flagellar biosynthesis anti-sigma factor FlgM [Polyangiales bacterium]
MKIRSPANTATTQALRSQKLGDKGSPTKTASASDQVQVSSGAQLLQQAGAPEAPDMERVQQLRDAIARGDFTIDVDKLAQRILAEEN